MSIDIDWTKLTAGPDGLELAETVREFIHGKFQQITLPRFIRSVEVHAFEFGDEPPRVELKDICDPLPEFYEDGEEEEDTEDTEDTSDDPRQGLERDTKSATAPAQTGKETRENLKERRDAGYLADLPINPPPLPHLRSGFFDHGLSRSSTPGIPGGTTNLSYFHLPLSAGLPGTRTPLAAVAGGTPFPPTWQYSFPGRSSLQQSSSIPDLARDDLSTRPSTAQSYVPAESLTDSEGKPVAQDRSEPEPTDIQIVLHIAYTGNLRLSLTAEILLDYPMPSFVGIPMKLNITGLSFDGIALIAYLKKRAHFCFLGQEDADMLVGAENKLDSPQDHDHSRDGKLGGLLREIKVESEIGQKDGGKQVLKNVGKVEKFVLDQVRKIFEDEFVYPSFWTFLL